MQLRDAQHGDLVKIVVEVAKTPVGINGIRIPDGGIKRVVYVDNDVLVELVSRPGPSYQRGTELTDRNGATWLAVGVDYFVLVADGAGNETSEVSLDVFSYNEVVDEFGPVVVTTQVATR